MNFTVLRPWGPLVLKSYKELLEYGIRECDFDEKPQGSVFRCPPLVCQYNAYETVTRKGFNPALAIVEGLQIIAQETNRKAISRTAPKTFKQGYFDGSAVEYGEKVGSYIYNVCHELEDNPATRRAVINIGSSELPFSNPRPCATTAHFQIEDFSLNTYVHMRSWDLVKGLPYNLVMWGIPTQFIAQCLGLRATEARITIFADNPHIYENDDEKCENLAQGPSLLLNPSFTEKVRNAKPKTPFHSFPRNIAREVLKEAPWNKAMPTSSWQRYPAGVVELIR